MASPRAAEPVFTWPKLWILYAAFCTLAGWGLSLLNALTAVNWLLCLAVALGFFWWNARRHPLAGARRNRWSARPLWRRRFRRPLPFLYLVLAFCGFARGFWNWEITVRDAASYRLPRMLHWIYDQGWHWIPTLDARMNTRGSGFEWMTSPFVLIGHSERFAFLLTAISFCLLPGLLFVLLRELGVRARVAWTWAWVFPTGYIFVCQAGTFSTDLAGAVFSMAAVGFALRARRTGSTELLVYSFLAAGLLTNQKASNLPLMLPVAIAWAMNWPMLRQRWTSVLPAMVVAAAVSYLPHAVANLRHTGTVMGMNMEPGVYHSAPPWAALPANAVLTAAYTLAPPILSPRGENRNLLNIVQSPTLRSYVNERFERTFGSFPNIVTEEHAGLGLGIGLLLLWQFGWRARSRDREDSALRFVRLGCWLALFSIFAASTIFALPRVLAPYYPLVLASFLLSARSGRVLRQVAWQRAAALAALVSIGLDFISTTLPPWPLRMVKVAERQLGHISKLRPVFQSFGANVVLHDFHREAGRSLPSDAAKFALAREWAEPELGYWVPFGTRKIEHLLPSDTRETLRERGIRYVIIAPFAPNRGSYEVRLGAKVVLKRTLHHPRLPELEVAVLDLTPD